tara:strand:- start:553 stop:810 length:258 start_codon:yes stop_codon:yes gene_type:complete
MTNAQSRFNDTKLPEWLKNQDFFANAGGGQQNWTWNSSKEVFVNKHGREIRYSKAIRTKLEEEAHRREQGIYRHELPRVRFPSVD